MNKEVKRRGESQLIIDDVAPAHVFGVAELAVYELFLFLAVVAVQLLVLLSQGLQLRVLAVGQRGKQLGKGGEEQLAGLLEP